MDISRLPSLRNVSARPTPGQTRNPLPEATGRGLVPLAGGSPRESNPGGSPRPSPAFLAHLIATAQHAPQTRARVRTAPADAIAHYTSRASVSVPSRTWEWSV